MAHLRTLLSKELRRLRRHKGADAEGNELQEVGIGAVAEMRFTSSSVKIMNVLNEMLAIQDGAHDLQLVVEVEEEVEDGDGHHNNIMRRDDQSVDDASLWSGRSA